MYLQHVLIEGYVFTADEQCNKPLEQAVSRLLAELCSNSCTRAASVPHKAALVPHHFVKQRFLGGVPGLIILHMAMVGMMCPVADAPACSMQGRGRLRFVRGPQLPAPPPPPNHTPPRGLQGVPALADGQFQARRIAACAVCRPCTWPVRLKAQWNWQCASFLRV